MNLIWDIIVIAFTISFIFWLPLFYWLIVGRNNSPTATQRRALERKIRLKKRRNL